MQTETIPVRVTQSGQTMDVVVYDKRVDHIIAVRGAAPNETETEPKT